MPVVGLVVVVVGVGGALSLVDVAAASVCCFCCCCCRFCCSWCSSLLLELLLLRLLLLFVVVVADGNLAIPTTYATQNRHESLQTYAFFSSPFPLTLLSTSNQQQPAAPISDTL